jgi:hypothetical protein
LVNRVAYSLVLCYPKAYVIIANQGIISKQRRGAAAGGGGRVVTATDGQTCPSVRPSFTSDKTMSIR